MKRIFEGTYVKHFTLFLCSVISSLALADEIPLRKSGLWEIEIINNDESPMVMKQCVDAASEMEASEVSKRIAVDMCTKNETRKEGDTYISEADCIMANNRTLTTTVITGDFSSHYKSEVTIRSVSEGSSTPDSNIVLNAKWLGECEPGQKPGQVIMSESN